MSALVLTRPLMRSRLSEEVEKVLLESIIAGRIAVGEKLPAERDLARSLEVNRSTVREALGRLESLDLVEIRHGDGVYVKSHLESGSLDLVRAMIRLDTKRRDEIIPCLLEFRTIVGPDMASRAAMYRTGEQLSAMEEVIRHDNGLEVMEKDIRMHHLIALASRNVLYLTLLNFFNKFVSEYGYLYFNDQANSDRSQRFHHEIYLAIEKQDPGLAHEIMRDVLAYAQNAVAEKLGRT